MTYIMLPILLAVTSVGDTETNAQRTCARQVHASATVTHIADLPQEVRDEMHRLKELFGGMADSDAPILQTDAPSALEATYAQVRFAQAMLVKDVWFVQYEVAMFSGVSTVSFGRDADGRYRWNPSHFFRGAACASIQAALAGVRTAPPTR